MIRRRPTVARLSNVVDDFEVLNISQSEVRQYGFFMKNEIEGKSRSAGF